MQRSNNSQINIFLRIKIECTSNCYKCATTETCDTCNAGYAKTGAGLCDQCKGGTYAGQGSTECSTCPSGTFSADGAKKSDECKSKE